MNTIRAHKAGCGDALSVSVDRCACGGRDFPEPSQPPDVADLVRPILDLATLKAVHEFYEMEALTDTQFDRWLHEQIIRARLGRDLTPEEVKAHLDF